MKSPARKWIATRMIEKDLSGAEIARSLGLKSRQHLYEVLGGRVRNAAIRRGICDALDLPYSIWEEIDKIKSKKAA
jgi:transcriptional regulator with XRE-family HTH domain